MDIPDELGSIQWFVEFMRLHNSGLVPSVSPPELLPSRIDMADYLGPKHGAGYTFNNHGSARYEQYIRELHRRVLQVNWPLGGILPFHFARGVVAEASGLEIDWAEFAYKITHPHQAHSRVPRVLPEFAVLMVPLPPLPKVLPTPIPMVSTRLRPCFLCHSLAISQFPVFKWGLFFVFFF